MKFAVVIQPPAVAEIEAAYLYIRAGSVVAADRWLLKIEEAIDSLEFMPKRCPIAPESKDFSREIRQLLVGRRDRKYRILFMIEGSTVRVLHVRHGARQWMKPGEI